MPVKNSLAILALAALISAGGGAALAAGASPGLCLDPAGQGPRQQDLNQDGIVDWVQNQNQWRASAGGQVGAWVDANQDGLHDAWQNQTAWNALTGGRYGSWVDANADGICDNFDLRPLDGSGKGLKGGN
jgi:hypothetical protein